MARKRDRIFALILAGLFFVFSFGASFYVIWQLYKDNHEAKTVNQQNTSNQSASNLQQQQQKADDKAQQVAGSNTGKLEGTKLANFTPVDKVDQLQSLDTVAGTGQEVKSGDTVTVDYTGALASTGVIFQSSLDSGQPISFSLNGVIKGWTDGVPGMKVGGTRRLLIPAAQAYGSNAQPGIPANSDLVFDITLHAIGK
jgi:FKBP-type peptidyl-prolyl cis-trans isomerase